MTVGEQVELHRRAGLHEVGRHEHAGPRHERPEHGALGADRRRQPAQRERPDEGDELDQQDGRHQRRLRQVELLAAVLRGHRDDRLDAVVVEQVGAEEPQGQRVGPHVPQRRAELAEAAAQRAAAPRRGLDVPGTAVAQQRDADDGEPGPPDAGRRQADPHRLGLGQAEAVVQREQGEVAGQQQRAAEVAERPAAAGDGVPLVGGGEVGQPRVVDDRRRAEAEVGDDEQRRRRAGSARRRRRTSPSWRASRASRTPPAAAACGRCGRRSRR